jgi:hypothetical protein
MAITLDPATRIFSVPQADLTFVSGTLYDADTNAIRKEVFDLLSSENYIWLPDAFIHNTEVTVAGVTYARFVEYINSFSLKFTPNSQWTVRLVGSNNNMFDVENGILEQNQVQVISTNAAGLISVTGGVGTPTEVADAVWDAATSAHTTSGTFGEKLGAKLLTFAQFIGLK